MKEALLLGFVLVLFTGLAPMQLAGQPKQPAAVFNPALDQILPQTRIPILRPPGCQQPSPRRTSSWHLAGFRKTGTLLSSTLRKLEAALRMRPGLGLDGRASRSAGHTPG
jgi:hypothetical protein